MAKKEQSMTVYTCDLCNVSQAVPDSKKVPPLWAVVNIERYDEQGKRLKPTTTEYWCPQCSHGKLWVPEETTSDGGGNGGGGGKPK